MSFTATPWWHLGESLKVKSLVPFEFFFVFRFLLFVFLSLLIIIMLCLLLDNPSFSDDPETIADNADPNFIYQKNI